MKREKIFQNLDKEILDKRIKISQPSFMKPMLATLTQKYFSDKNWIFEPKFDGERCLAFKKQGKVNLLSRNNLNINNVYPELVTTLEKQGADNFIIDGEIVAMKNGVSDFQVLQERINLRNSLEVKEIISRVPVVYCIFDLVYVAGYDVCNLPLYARKELLLNLLNYNSLLFYTNHKIEDGIGSYRMACGKRWEGVIAKKFDSTYVHVRSNNWLKFKCSYEQELVIGGYTNPKGERKHFGALLVGYYEKDQLKYAGKVGTGFDQDTLKMLGNRLKNLEIKECPFSNYQGSKKDIHWVKPHLVAEFKFAQWTESGKLRVPRYKGLRPDKGAKEVVKEVPL